MFSTPPSRLSRLLRFTSVTSLALMPLAATADTATEVKDLQEQVDNLQQQIDALNPPGKLPVLTNRKNVRLEFSGRISAGVLYADQGDQDQVFFADNDASGSRFGLTAEADFNENLTAGARFEISAEVNSTDDIDFGDVPGPADDASDFGDVRHAEAYLKGRFGLVSIGQGNTAAEDSAHSDLSGTSLAGAGSDVDDIAGGLSFLPASGDVLGSAGDVDAFFDIQDGARDTRLLYQTPGFNGLRLDLSVATSDDESTVDPAIGLFYGKEFGDLELEASGSYRIENDGDADNDFFVGSASVLHSSGLNLTVAGSVGNIEGQDEDTTAFFVKLGYRTKFNSLGEMRFSVDYFRGENNADFASPLGELPEAESYGVSVVQALSRTNAELFASYRRYEVSDVFVNGALADIDGLDVFFAGARFRF